MNSNTSNIDFASRLDPSSMAKPAPVQSIPPPSQRSTASRTKARKVTEQQRNELQSDGAQATQTRQAKTNSRCVENLLTTRPETPTDEEGDDVPTDEEDIDKQLVMWAGRLELESIDLRECSKGLICAFHDNSKALQCATEQLNGVLPKFLSASTKQSSSGGESSEKSMTQVNVKLAGITTSLKKILDSQKPPATRPDRAVLDAISRLSKRISQIPGTVSDSLMLSTVQKMEKRLDSITKTIEKIAISGHQRPSKKTSQDVDLKELSTNLGICARRLEDITNLQIDFNKKMAEMNKTQDTMKAEIDLLKSKVTSNTSFAPATPECSSYNIPPSMTPSSYKNIRYEVTKPTHYAKRFKSHRQPRSERLLLQLSQQNSEIVVLDDEHVSEV